MLTWGMASSAGSIWRSSQPKVGMQMNTCFSDEALLSLIASAKQPTPVVHIVDCRPRTSALANSLGGHGVENTLRYPDAKISFWDMENIHSIREAYCRLEKLCLGTAVKDLNWGSAVEETRWLEHLRLLLSASLEVARLVHLREEPVLVHCSHGWDRTAQVAALAQIFLDPYFRTIDGFGVLVEKDFLSFGHPFQLRMAHGMSQESRDASQMAPIFLQFIDAVWQLVHQFPSFFEFNSRFLLSITEHLHSCRFGTFLFNCERERREIGLEARTVSLWSFLSLNRSSYQSLLYQRDVGLKMTADSSVFLPPRSCLLRNVCLWTDYFLRFSPAPSFSCSPSVAVPSSSQRRVAHDGAYDEREIDTSACSEGDLKVAEAALVSGHWEAAVRAASSEGEKWRAKALQERMRLMQSSTDDSSWNSAEAASISAEVKRLRELVKEQKKTIDGLIAQREATKHS